MTPIIIVGGNAFRLDSSNPTRHAGGKILTLVCAPVLADGRIEDNWGEVDFYSIEEREAENCRLIESALREIELRGLPGWQS